MARRAERLIERVALAIFICPGIAAYFASHAIELPFARIVSLLAGCWAAAALLLSVPHCLRFGEGLAGTMAVGLALAAVFVLPLLPYLTIERSLPGNVTLYFLVTLVVMIQTAKVVAWGFRNQGRHFHTDRELPELECLAPREPGCMPPPPGKAR